MFRLRPSFFVQPTAFKWEPGAPARIFLGATFAGAASGLVLAAFQVQGWTMPKPLALALIGLLLAMVVVSVAVVLYEVAHGVYRFFDERSTSADWVASTPPGLLDYEPDGIRANERFSKEVYKLNDDTETLGKRLDKHSKRMARSGAKSGRKKQKLANRSAKDIDQSAAFIEKRLELLDAIVKEIRRNAEGLIASLGLETDENLSEAKEFSDVLKEGRDTTVGAADSVDGYCETVRDIEQQNPARTMRLACQRLGPALDGVAKVLRRHATGSLNNAQALDRKVAEAETAIETVVSEL